MINSEFEYSNDIERLIVAVDSELLTRWPSDRPVGLLALGPRSDSLVELISNEPNVARWWVATAQNMFVGPSPEAPFDTMVFFEARDPETAARLVNVGIGDHASGRWTILAGNPAPTLARWMMRAMHLALRWLPDPPAPEPDLANSAATAEGGVNPTSEQLEAVAEQPAEAPVMVLNLNSHHREGIHPDTGKPGSGHDLANLYFKRGIKTFNRLGARAIWIGSCRGALRDDLNAGAFDQIGLILYPTRRSFDTLLRIGMREGWNRYRQAGLDHSWNVHCQITESSEPGDVS